MASQHLGAIKAVATAVMIFASAMSPAIYGVLFDAGVTVPAVGRDQHRLRGAGVGERVGCAAARVSDAMRPAPDTYTPPPDDALPVVHLDDHLIVLDKPSGLLSVPGKGEALADCLEARVQARHPASALTVHRLDRDTSGLVVMAMTPQAQRHLGLQFERRKLAKTYIAIVSGVIAQDAGEIDLPLIADWPNRPLQKVCHETGKPALTRWRVLERTSYNPRTA
jgi:23S rRNA-/tRNA-specific pseudouridylate synthase